MSICYTVYGLTLAVEFPFFTPLFPTESETFDLKLIYTSEPQWTSAEWESARFVSYAEDFQIELRADGERYMFAVASQLPGSDSTGAFAAVQWAIEGTHIRCCFSMPMLPHYLEYLLLEIILPRYLQLRGMVLFHAAVVEIDGRAVLLSAPTGTGKSTLTMLLVQRGARFMSDDLAAIRESDGCYEVVGSYPSSRLHKDSITMLGVASRESFPKHVIEGFDWAEFRSAPAPVGAIYVLQRSSTQEGIRIEPLHGHRGLTRLLFDAQNDSPFAAPDIITQQREAAFVLQLMRRIPTRLLSYPSDFKRLGEVADCLVADLHVT